MLGVWVLLLSGCGHTQPSRFYLLQSIPGMEKDKHAATNGQSLTICVGPVMIPKYLDRPQIVTTTKTSELKLAEFDRWAEPFKDNFSRVLTENLSEALETDRVAVFPRESAASSDYQIIVTVIRFDGESGGNAVLSARWSIYGEGGKKELFSKKSDLSEPAGVQGYEALVSAQSRMIAGLSKEIAGAIKALGQGKTP
jgi:Uncharacterized protein conserved in bacteria